MKKGLIILSVLMIVALCFTMIACDEKVLDQKQNATPLPSAGNGGSSAGGQGNGGSNSSGQGSGESTPSASTRYKIGAQAGTTSEYYLKGDEDWGFDGCSNVDCQTYDTVVVALQALRNGTINAVLTDKETATALVSSQSGIKLVNYKLTEEEYAIGVDKAQPELLASINQVLAQIKRDGTLDEIIMKYAGGGEITGITSATYETSEANHQLVVAINACFAPFEYKIGDKFAGIDVEIAKEIAERLDLELVLEDMDFAATFDAVGKNGVDITINAVAINEERKEIMNFSDVYYDTGLMLIVRTTDTTFNGCRSAEDVEALLKNSPNQNQGGNQSQGTNQGTTSGTPTSLSDIKFGLITLHDENSTYDKNFIDAAKFALSDLGLRDDQLVIKSGVSESADCYYAAVDLVDQGCNVILADSFGYEDHLLQAAREYPNVRFCNALGWMASVAGVPNYHNSYPAIYEGRYLTGVAAGLKLNEMIQAGSITADQAVIGYVDAYSYQECISSRTAFYLGAKSVCPTVTMKVKCVGSWYDMTKENEAARELINDYRCVLISQYSDSMGAPSACAQAGIPNVTYNVSTKEYTPDTYLIGCKINWAPYIEYIITQTANGSTILPDYVGSLADGSVILTELNESVAAAGTLEKLNEVKAKLLSGEIEVFDTRTFTVNGRRVTSYLADAIYDENNTPDTEAIVSGVFKESYFRSSPYFDILIDGITVL